MNMFVVGGSGYIGSEIMSAASDAGLDVAGSYKSNKRPELTQVDVSNSSTWGQIEALQPEAVVWSARMPGIAADRLMALMARLGQSKHIYLSSDVVLCEKALTHNSPLGEYARQKKAEQSIFEKTNGALILQPGPVCGVNSRGERDKRTLKIIEAVNSAVGFGQWTDVYKRFCNVQDLARIVIEHKDKEGTYLVGPEETSYYEHYINVIESIGLLTDGIYPEIISDDDLAMLGVCRQIESFGNQQRLH